MKIEDVTYNLYSKFYEDVKPQRAEKGEEAPPAAQPVEVKRRPPAEQAPADQMEKMRRMISEGVKRYLEYQNWSVNLYIHKPTNTVAAKIVDNETGDVIREIPPEELLNLRARFYEMIRQLFRQGG